MDWARIIKGLQNGAVKFPAILARALQGRIARRRLRREGRFRGELWSGSCFAVIESLVHTGTAAPPTLPPTDRDAVLAWLELARLSGIEEVQDLRRRPWPVATEATILGVFRTAESYAGWLVVGQADGWAVASCDHNQVIGTSETLSGALALILPAGLPTAPQPRRPVA